MKSDQALVVTPPSSLSAAEINMHLDAILKASGSALRHFSMHKTLEDMRMAARALADAAAAKAASVQALGQEENNKPATLSDLIAQGFTIKRHPETNCTELVSAQPFLWSPETEECDGEHWTESLALAEHTGRSGSFSLVWHGILSDDDVVPHSIFVISKLLRGAATT